MRQRNVRPVEEVEDQPSRFRSIARQVKSLDMYPKVEEDQEIHTNSGGTVSIISIGIIVLLFLSELRAYFTIRTVEHLSVDTNRQHTMDLNFNITFPNLACHYTNIDAMDNSGDQQLSVDDNIFKIRLDEEGNQLGIAQQDIINEEQKEENPSDSVGPGVGCLTYGTLVINKVSGNIHVAIGHSSKRGGRHVHSFGMPEIFAFNISHTIHHLSFGKLYPGIVNPLEKRHFTTNSSQTLIQYFIKIIPTTYNFWNGDVLKTNQYSVIEQHHDLDLLNEHPDWQGHADAGKIPGLFFMYDISPFVVEVKQSGVGFAHLLTNLCAIVGGVFTIAGLLDSCIFYGQRLSKKK